jgi:hypothetical protein
MRFTKFSVLLGLGLVMALLAGCFSPIGVTSYDDDAMDNAPFEVEITIGQTRSVVGGTKANIKAGLYNYMQLVVVDGAGNIVAYDEARKAASNSEPATLQIDTIPYGAAYKFLLLFGDWPRQISDESPNGNLVTYVYNDSSGVKPTLLASGYKEHTVQGDGTITIQMWPLVIDTKIKQGSGYSSYNPTRGVITEVFQGVGNGEVAWQIGKNEDGSGNGVEALITAGGLGSPTLYIYNWQKPPTSLSMPSFRNELPIADTLPDIGTEYTAYFNIEYIPFNKIAPANWTGFTSDYFNLAQVPKWIIRNGLNDNKQNSFTDFDKVGKPVAAGYNYKDYNGNGGIPLKVKETLGFTDDDGDGIPDGVLDTTPAGGDGSPEAPGSSDSGKYLLYAGKFFGKNGTTANISFSTSGYNGDAQVYSLVTAKDAYSKDNWPPYNLFTSLGDYAEGTHGTSSTPIAVTNPLISGGDVDIWLVFIKDGKVSNRIRINTGSGSIEIISYWGITVNFSDIIIIPGSQLTASSFAPYSIEEYYSNQSVWETSTDGYSWTQIYVEAPIDRHNAFYRVTYPLHANLGHGFDGDYASYYGSIGGDINVGIIYYNYLDMDVVYTFEKQ